ncbi:GNAT family N-acetyltransferase [Melittangium boletus]|uniref:Acetyltransferase n=1 Tax=Melittangium boletus DSM 14713 TaxID=1294270 RepID=A0A250IA36_9BACT|nr:acetyltransferase [Melittangium boletus DSM 14713]
MIRSATPEDVPAIARLIRALAEYEKLSHEVVLEQEALRRHLFGERPHAEVVLAEQGGQVVGFALFFHTYSTFLSRPSLYLEDLFVLPEHRGQGHGKGLLTHLARLAVERGCGRFEWSVLDWNAPAIAFYKSVGAVPMSDWTVFRVTGDALHRLAGRS